MLIVKAPQFNAGGGFRPSLRCPACRQLGVFEALTNVHDVQVAVAPNYWLGQKRCPNAKCNAIVFVVLDHTANLVRSYPAELIDFDSSNIPLAVTTSFQEALTCHSEECYIACAIMIRRTLEEVCTDKNATGSNLKDRIASLKSRVVLPLELFSAMDELRLLGNDAAHIEAKSYDDVGKDETEVAIALTKEILKAVYQLDDLVRRLQALKK
jgi:hypothetical protein